jgi:hypothetical protein
MDDTAEGTHGRVCDLATEGRRPMDLGTKDDDGPASPRTNSVHRKDLVTQVDRLVSHPKIPNFEM